jgi:hypothetical protein
MKRIWEYFNPTGADDEYEELILLQVKNTRYPDKFSEGVFAWHDKNQRLHSSLQYHAERGGDPEVWWGWFEDNKDGLEKIS